MSWLDSYMFPLPPELIAQHPEPRGREYARLLVVDRGRKTCQEGTFADITGLLRSGDALVCNDTRVLPGRIDGQRPGGGKAEFLFLHPVSGRNPPGREEWRTLIRPARRLRPGLVIEFGPDTGAELKEKNDGIWRVEVHSAVPFREWLGIHGMAPMPPYIKRKGNERCREDLADYQTIFSRKEGSIAAPTAGLHFSEKLLDAVREKGIYIFFLTLQLGPFEFLPPGKFGDDGLPPEDYEIPSMTAEGIENARKRGNRVCAVGTTTVRALESNYREFGRIHPARGKAGIYIRPGHRFQAVDALVTNFHRPGSSMLALTCTFGGKELILSAYEFAVERKFRFLSLGDAMIVL